MNFSRVCEMLKDPNFIKEFTENDTAGLEGEEEKEDEGFDPMEEMKGDPKND